MRFSIASLALGFLVSACGGGGTADGGADAGRPDLGAQCVADSDCSDGQYCNGVETCNHTLGADARGCLAPTVLPCLAEQTCDETTNTCHTDCARTGDADGDGHTAVSCGGDDCNDTSSAI